MNHFLEVLKYCISTEVLIGATVNLWNMCYKLNSNKHPVKTRKWWEADLLTNYGLTSQRL